MTWRHSYDPAVFDGLDVGYCRGCGTDMRDEPVGELMCATCLAIEEEHP